ncbi:MAG: alpha/beta hydrolase, partial [Candidatus Hodarchaeales archaeon]
MNSNNTSFTEEEVQFQVENITLSGTVSIPKKGEKCPAVVLLSGYGPCNRDYEEQGLKKFLILSDYLARNGIAVLRYDDRGAGRSSSVNWSQYTYNDLSDEALAAMDILRNYKEINSNKIGLIGHSLGAAIAPLAASQSKGVNFIVIIGGYGLIGSKTATITRSYLGPVLGESKKDTEEGVKLVNRIFQAILSEEGWEEAYSLVQEKMNARFERMSEDQQKFFKTAENYMKFTYEGFLLSEG